MEVDRYIAVRIETFIKVRFAIAVDVVQFCQSIFASDVDYAVDDLDAQGFVQPARETFPFQFG